MLHYISSFNHSKKYSRRVETHLPVKDETYDVLVSKMPPLRLYSWRTHQAIADWLPLRKSDFAGEANERTRLSLILQFSFLENVRSIYTLVSLQLPKLACMNKNHRRSILGSTVSGLFFESHSRQCSSEALSGLSPSSQEMPCFIFRTFEIFWLSP